MSRKVKGEAELVSSLYPFRASHRGLASVIWMMTLSTEEDQRVVRRGAHKDSCPAQVDQLGSHKDF